MVSKRAAKIAQRNLEAKKDARMARMEKFIEHLAAKEGFDLDELPEEVVEIVKTEKEAPVAPAESEVDSDQDKDSTSPDEAETGDSDNSNPFTELTDKINKK